MLSQEVDDKPLVLKDADLDGAVPEWDELQGVWKLRCALTGRYFDEVHLPKDAHQYSPALSQIICGQIMQGQTLTTICDRDDMPSLAAVFYWQKKYPAFKDAIRFSKQAFAERLHDKVLHEAEELSRGGLNKNDMEGKRGAIDAYKWSASKLDRGAFGENPKHEGVGAVTVVFNTGIDREDAIEVSVNGVSNKEESDVTTRGE